MAGEATKVIDSKVLWGGGRSPFSISYGKMMMWFFLISDALTFGGLLTMLGAFKVKYMDIWPVSEEVFHAFPYMGHTHLPLMYVALMTFILIVSSVTMVLAVEAGHRMDKKGVVRWLFLTVIGGFFFLFSQVWEWSHYIHGTEVGAVEIDGGGLKEYGITDDHIAQGLIAHYADAEGKKIESVEDLPLSEEAQAEVLELLEVVRHGVGLEERRIATKEYADVLAKSGVSVRLPIKDEQGQYKVIKGAEASKLIDEGRIVHGASLTENEYGQRQYSQFFFFVTGFHGFHVFSGVVINIIILIGVMKGIYHKRNHYEMVEKTGLYWHFVDLVWVFVFTFYYLI
ncbi:MAG: cytochrome c oxidase subunit 3 [Flavobacteriales bacterium]|nr:cytochrome c oxidase subunit 3 [Flavobacteriales bacterium]